MTKNIVIVAGGALALEMYEYLLDAIEAERGLKAEGTELAVSAVNIVGYLDDSVGRSNDFAHILPKIGAPRDYVPLADTLHLIAVGDPDDRQKLWSNLVARGASFLQLFHPSAIVARTARIGVGCVVGPFGFVGAMARVGSNTFLNTYASIGHDAIVGDHCVLSPYATANGNVVLGDRCFLGSSATVIPDGQMGDGSKLSAGSVHSSVVGSGYLLTGNPAQGRVMYRPKS